MNRGKIEKLRTMFPGYFDRSIEAIRDGWFRAVEHFLFQLKDIGDQADCVTVRFERMPYGLQAFVAPRQFPWTGEAALALVKAQEALLLGSQSLCEVCGLPPITTLPGATDRSPVGFFCEEHLPSATAQVDQEKSVWSDLAFLFTDGPPALDPGMPDDVRKIVFEYLTKIAEQVREDEQVGYVYIQIAFVDGSLLMRPVHVPGGALSTAMAVNDLCLAAEELTDTRPYIQDWTTRARVIFGSLIADDCMIRLTSDQFYKLHLVLVDVRAMNVGFVLKSCIDWNPGYEVDYDCDTTPALDSEVDALMSALVARMGFHDTNRPILPEAPGGRE